MSNKQVVQDEREAEARYQQAIRAAQAAAHDLAQAVADESRRAAALETAQAIQKAEDARKAAENVPVEQVKKSFWDRLFG